MVHISQIHSGDAELVELPRSCWRSRSTRIERIRRRQAEGVFEDAVREIARRGRNRRCRRAICMRSMKRMPHS
jgi:hypothetical protein